MIISVDRGSHESAPSLTFRFYVRREHDRWISDDRNGYCEAVLILLAVTVTAIEEARSELQNALAQQQPLSDTYGFPLGAQVSTAPSR